MKKVSFCLLFFLYILSAHGQERHFNKISFGFQLVKLQNEFGFGIHLLTPEFKNLRLNAKINLNWLNHADYQNNQIWSEFLNNQVGVNYHKSITNRINLYSEGGLVLLYPNSLFSDESISFGGYGLFGFEFFFTENKSRNPSYFIELGGIGTGAVANKVVSHPIYANGFLISVGYRF